MCGIFGFMLEKPVGMAEVFKVLEKSEVHRYPNEFRPVGGYGAGVAVLQGDGKIILQKIARALCASFEKATPLWFLCFTVIWLQIPSQRVGLCKVYM